MIKVLVTFLLQSVLVLNASRVARLCKFVRSGIWLSWTFLFILSLAGFVCGEWRYLIFLNLACTRYEYKL